MSEDALIAALQNGPLGYDALAEILNCARSSVSDRALRTDKVGRRKLYNGKIGTPKVVFYLKEGN